jgi:hypothetical protein
MLLALSVFAAILVVSTFFLSLKTNTTSDKAPSSSEAKSSSENKAPAPTAANQPNAAASAEKPPEPEILNLIFTQEQNQDSFHYINNADVGQILVILGRIQNGYDEPVSHIRVKAALKNSAGAILAERQVFAGNTLTQEELQTLSMKEILAKLSLRGGQNGLNLNISPGKEVPYMFVFDKLPGDLKEYQVEPVSCVLTSQALSSIQSPPAATPDPAAPNRR